jgi:thiol:disulfide interchange protein DsbD
LLGSAGVLLGQAEAPAKRPDPVKWSLALEPSAAAPGGKVLGRLKATVEAGWHFYAPTSPKPTIASTIGLADSPVVKSAKVWAPAAVRKLDPYFKIETEYYEADTEFLLEVELADGAAGSAELAAQVRYQACDDRFCLLPVRRTAAATLRINPEARTAAPAIPAGYSEVKTAAAAPAPVPPVQTTQPRQEGTWQFILLALSFGFLAIFTPCVFPMIPITMSYFLGSRPGSRIAQAVTFCVGVIVLFTGLGAGVTALAGPFGLTRLGGNPWVNLFIALLFLAFGLSLLGAFEITVPSGVLTRLTEASGRGGTGGTVLMGLAFALASFACTGPFVGTLLASSAQGGLYWPVLGMFAFSAGMASPFFFLALFPAYVSRLPKSGGWLARTKAVLGFFILAFMFKYLSNIDQVYQWNLLTRERFLSIWVVLLGLAGLYLLGVWRLAGEKDEPLSLWRMSAAAAILVLAVSLIPGMFGARLGEIDAYVPAPSGSGFSSSGGPQLKWLKDDYQSALAEARQTGKPVFVSFTGYACTNCHWMKANMFTRPEIAAQMQDFVLVELYTDGADPASEANQKLLEGRFGIIAIPYYALIRPDDTVIATFPGLTRNAGEFEAFLKRGISPTPSVR